MKIVLKTWWKANGKRLVKFLIGVFIFYVFFDLTVVSNDKPKEVKYQEYIESLKKGDVDTVYYEPSSETMRYTLLNEETRKMKYEERLEYKYDDENWRMTAYPGYEEFRKDLLEKGVRVVVKDFSPKSLMILQLLMSLSFPCLLIYFVISLGRQFSVMKSVSNNFEDLVETSDVRFDDVIGLDEILDDVKFIVEMLKNPDLGEKTGAKLPKGVLFSGDPGTGKTLIAKAIAGEANVPFIYVNASSFVEMFVGLGAKRVRDLFKTAREHTPCIMFIDEIDAVGGKRSSRNNNGESDQTLNALLQEMDGFSTKEGLFIIGATNLPDKLDKALVRSGRFDRKLQINPPRDWKVRKEMFDFYLKDKPLVEGVDIESIARQTVGFTGADISAIVNEASIISAMNDKEIIDMNSLEEAVDKHIFKGNRSKEKKQNDDREVVAYHEAGHAVASYVLGVRLARASIIGTTSGVGGAVFQQESDSQFKTKEDFEKDIMVCYAGRASESYKFRSISTGAANDISQATSKIQMFVQKYGFDSDFGLLDMDILQDNALIDAQFILEKMSKLSNEYYNKVYEIIEDNYDLVEKLAQALLKYESLSADSIYEVLEG